MIESIINSKKIKYVDLSDRFIKNLPHNTDEIRMFISLDSIISDMQNNTDALNELSSDDQYIKLSSEIINLVAHYRKFFYSRYKMKSSYIFYYSKSIITTNNKIVKTNILKNMKLLHIVLDYLPDISIVEVSILQSEVVPYHIITNENNATKIVTNIVLTGKKTDFQLVNLPSTYLFYSVRGNTKLVTKDNVYPTLNKNKNDEFCTMTSNLVSLVISFNGDKTRLVDGIPKYKFVTIIQRMKMLISQNKIANQYHNIMDINKVLIHFNLETSMYTLMQGYFAKIDMIFAYENIPQYDLDKINTRDKYIESNETIMEINSRYYQLNPIQLLEIFEGIE